MNRHALVRIRHVLARARVLRVAAGWLNIRTTHRMTYLGNQFEAPGGSLIGEHIQSGGEWDAVLYKITDEIIEGDHPVICEVGSNIGASLLQIVRARPGALLVAYEPSRRYRSILITNLRHSGVSAVRVEAAFLGAIAGKTWLYNNESTASAVAREYDGHESRGQQRVRIHTLDASYRGPRPIAFLKVDTDGYDFEVLRGAREILARDQPLLFFEFAPHLSIRDHLEGLRFVQSVGYHVFVCFSAVGQLLGVTSEPTEVVQHADNSHRYCDVLAAVEGTQLAARVDAALRNGALTTGPPVASHT